MGKHKFATIEELRVNAVKSRYHFLRYKNAVESMQRKEEIKSENFEDFLAEESKKCVLGYNPYQE